MKTMFSGFVWAMAVDARDLWLFSFHSSEITEKNMEIMKKHGNHEKTAKP
jgi:hypothetical protein